MFIEINVASLNLMSMCPSSFTSDFADFFSFGTNDLTQMTYGYSRDDVNGFLPLYIENSIIEIDPFQTLDQVGVGKLITEGFEGIKKAWTTWFENVKKG